MFWNGEGFKKLIFLLLLDDEFGKILAHIFIYPLYIAGRRQLCTIAPLIDIRNVIADDVSQGDKFGLRKGNELF